MEKAEKTAWFAILTNSGLVGIKSFLAVISGSMAIKADAIHSLTDVLSSVIILLGIKTSRRKSRDFPYGLYKLENLIALGTSFLILLAGYEIVREAIGTHMADQPRQISLALLGILLTIVITGLFSRYELKVGTETGSPSLIADARHIWTDMLSSLVILASLLGNAVGWNVDRYAALIVVLFIGRAAFAVFLDSIRVLLDASLDQDSLEQIRRIVLADPRVVAVNELRARNAGRYKFVELDLTLRVKNLEKGHRVVEEIKQRIKSSVKNVDHVSAHYEPQKKDHLILAIPLAGDLQSISEHFGEAPFFRLIKIQTTNGTITADSVVANPLVHETKGKGIKVANWLLEQGLDLLIVHKALDGRGPAYVLGNSEVEILVVSETDPETALNTIRSSLNSQGAASPSET